MMPLTRFQTPVLLMIGLLLAGLMTGCGATARQVLPTDRPTATATFTATTTRIPGPNTTPTVSTTPLFLTATGGPSPTSIFGATSTPAPVTLTATLSVNPNAPVVEFFTSDVLYAAPGDAITLRWSARRATSATIYRLDKDGTRNQVWNVPPDGSLQVQTRRSERGEVDFVLNVANGVLTTEQTLTIPLTCPDTWFFQPSPLDCPAAPAQPTLLIEEPFERGRMVYIQSTNRVYVLFNDGSSPAWISFENRYDPAIHPELEESFVPPPPFVQPIRILGFVWRGNDVVRNRLGLGLDAQFEYEGFTQSAGNTGGDGATSLYMNSVDGTVLQLLPGGTAWQIITPP
ncbi:MAG: hypothetical protein H6672_04645 [Anaerolineaceae bacterium]|nr:hypothetical protein [Anaerolineaceae bacterium]